MNSPQSTAPANATNTPERGKKKPTGKRSAPETAPVSFPVARRYDYPRILVWDRNLTGQEAKVLQAIWNRTNDRRETLAAWQSIETLAAELGRRNAAGEISTTSTKTHLSSLRAKGYLQEHEPGTWGHMIRDQDGKPTHDVTTLRVLALPTGHPALSEDWDAVKSPADWKSEEGVPKTGTPGVPKTGTSGVPKTGTQTDKGIHKINMETPYAPAAPPTGSTGEAMEDEQQESPSTSTDRWAGKRDHHGVLYESVPKAALIAWAHYRVHGDEQEEQQARAYVLATFRDRNGDEFADWAEEFGGFTRGRAQEILDACKAEGESGARYVAGAIYGELMNAAPWDEFHPATVDNGPRIHASYRAVVGREDIPEILAQQSQGLPEEVQAAPIMSGPVALDVPAARVMSARKIDEEAEEAAQLQEAEEAQEQLRAAVREQEAQETRRAREEARQARLDVDARLDAAKAEAEALRQARAEQEDPSTGLTVQDWAEIHEQFPPGELIPTPEQWAVIRDAQADLRPEDLDDWTAIWGPLGGFHGTETVHEHRGDLDALNAPQEPAQDPERASFRMALSPSETWTTAVPGQGLPTTTSTPRSTRA